MMKVQYTGPEQREFGGRILDRKFRVPVKQRGEDGKLLPRLVEWVTTDEDGVEHTTTEVAQGVGDALLLVTSDAPRVKDRELVYAAYEPESAQEGVAVNSAAVHSPTTPPAQPAPNVDAKNSTPKKG